MNDQTSHIILVERDGSLTEIEDVAIDQIPYYSHCIAIEDSSGVTYPQGEE